MVESRKLFGFRLPRTQDICPSATGWRKTAVILTIVATLVTILVLVFFALSLARHNTQASYNTTVIMDGPCDETAKLNLALHLMLNVVSTGILASSNFFMQVLSSPSRGEIDEAHSQQKTLNIGILSVSNVFLQGSWGLFRVKAFGFGRSEESVGLRFEQGYRSKLRPGSGGGVNMWFRRMLYIGLAMSSIPLHLFFNSSIFQVDITSAYVAALASESFVTGAGEAGGNWMYPGVNRGYFGQKEMFGVDLGDNLTYIHENVGGWERLEGPECWNLYGSVPLYEHRHVVIVVETADAPVKEDWRVADVRMACNDTAVKTMDNFTDYVVSGCWNRKVHNALFEQVMCSTDRQWWGSKIGSDCRRLFATFDGMPDRDRYDEAQKQITPPQAGEVWNVSASNFNIAWAETYNPQYERLAAKYCLTEPVDFGCRLESSNLFLGVVLVCCVFKTASCFAILLRLWGQDLILTPGDAVASFIETPDCTTRDMCAATEEDFREMQRKGTPWRAMPKKWKAERKRWAAAVPLTSWIPTYMFYAASLAVISWLFSAAYRHDNLSFSGTSWGRSIENPIIQELIPDSNEEPVKSLLSGAIYANLAQLLFSVGYLLCNSIFTRMLLAKEWGQLSTRYKALRVTGPRGKQRSTFRLQLPYKYSIPLILMSILLHWLISNSVYLFVLEERDVPHTDYTNINGKLEPIRSWEAVSRVSVGYSSQAILTSLLVLLVLVLSPIAVGMKKIPGYMPLVGCCSGAVSAACHPPPASKQSASGAGEWTRYADPARSFSGTIDGMEITDSRVEGSAYDAGQYGDEYELLPTRPQMYSTDGFATDVAYRELKWGVVAGEGRTMRVGRIEEGTRPVGHLTFGTLDEDVHEPVEGKYYA